MHAFVSLESGAVSFLSGFHWPIPTESTPGPWVVAGVDAEPDVVRGHTHADLPWWLDDELWRIELAGDVRRHGRAVLGERGRLVGRVEAWTPEVAWELVEACARRVRDAAVDELRAAGLERDAAELVACADPLEIERVGSSIGPASGPQSRLAGFAADVVLYAGDAGGGARGAGVAAYVAAHALAGGEPSAAGYVERFDRERQWQAEWLRRRLRL